MPRRSDIPRTESDRFHRENPLPTDRKLYLSRRAEAYPETLTGSHPRATQDAHHRYTQLKHHCDRVQETYVEANTEEEKRFQRLSEPQREYYRATSASILPTGHSRLEPMARRVGDSELAQARSRRDAFEQHDYMYPDIDSKERHFGLVRDHYRDSAEGYNNADTHVRYGSARPPSRNRDLYDNEPTRDYSPYREPYPPHFPPSEHYSTARGDDEESSGGEWSSVKKPSKASTSARHAARRPR